MANTSYTGNSVLDGLLAQRQQQQGFNMFNPNDAYMSFTSQVANTPNWWESLARAATAPLFMTGLRLANKYSNPKDNGGLTDEQKATNRTNFNNYVNDNMTLQNNLQNQAGVPENQRIFSLLGNNFDAGVRNNYYNPALSNYGNITAGQMWNTPQKDETFYDYANRVSPPWDWRKNLLQTVDWR